MNKREEPKASAFTAAVSVAGQGAFMALGGTPPMLPGVSFDYRPGAPCAGILLLGPVEQAQLAGVLAGVPDPALPIADFADNCALRRDYTGKDLVENFQHVEKTFSPIWSRLKELPYYEDIAAREELTTLRLAYSRNASIEAKFDVTSPRLVEYPLLGKLSGIRRRLEMLARLDLLARTHFARMHKCAKCGSARLNAYEACPGCGGAELEEESLVHHYQCGFQAPESRFADRHLLICPKCRHALQHFGVDYGKPGKVAVCAVCHAVNTEPPVAFACLDCAAVTSAGEAKETDWYHYRITEEGICSLREGQLPRFDITPLLAGAPYAHSPQEFRLLASHEMKVTKRSKRPFSVARFSVLNLENVIRERGPVATEAGFRRVVAAVLAVVREGDFIGVGSSISALIGFPDTSAKSAKIIAERVRQTVRATADTRVELGVEIAEGDAVAELLSRS